MKILITDIDEVLLDWSDSFDKFLRENYGYDECHLRDNPKRLWEVVGVHERDIGGIMNIHNDSPTFAQLDYKNDSAILKNHYKKFDKIIAVTSCGSENSIQQKRIQNLKYKFGDIIDEIEFLDFLNPKHEALEKIKDRFSDAKIYMIDDSVKDVEYARSIGINAYVYKATFHDPKDLPVVDSFTQFLEKL
jgi:FMN phosphatase YigB (HAD superfamily)